MLSFGVATAESERKKEFVQGWVLEVSKKDFEWKKRRDGGKSTGED